MYRPWTYETQKLKRGDEKAHSARMVEAGREGIVIVQPRLTYAYLRNVSRLSFADSTHALKVKRWLEPPPREASNRSSSNRRRW
jgi:hypothetical protein